MTRRERIREEVDRCPHVADARKRLDFAKAKASRHFAQERSYRRLRSDRRPGYASIRESARRAQRAIEDAEAALAFAVTDATARVDAAIAAERKIIEDERRAREIHHAAVCAEYSAAIDAIAFMRSAHKKELAPALARYERLKAQLADLRKAK